MEQFAPACPLDIRMLPLTLRRGDGRRGWLLAVFLFLLVTWVRWSFVRIRVDQILALSWKVLMPATLLLLVATGIVVVLRTAP